MSEMATSNAPDERPDRGGARAGSDDADVLALLDGFTHARRAPTTAPVTYTVVSPFAQAPPQVDDGRHESGSRDSDIGSAET